jgi:hypothetical protein
MTDNRSSSSLPEFSLDHLPTHQIRQHLIDLTVELSAAILDVDDDDPTRLIALSELYQVTLQALNRRTRRVS